MGRVKGTDLLVGFAMTIAVAAAVGYGLARALLWYAPVTLDGGTP